MKQNDKSAKDIPRELQDAKPTRPELNEAPDTAEDTYPTPDKRIDGLRDEDLENQREQQRDKSK